MLAEGPKHTPGPWRVGFGDAPLRVVSDRRMDERQFNSCEEARDAAESLNRLEAASPALLAACEAVEEVLRTQYRDDAKLMILLRDAIKAARGTG